MTDGPLAEPRRNGPTRIGKYELQDYLGGGMSRVYKAHDPLMRRTVAVKILTPETAADVDAKARFLREAQTVGSLNHDNIMRVYDYGEENGLPYMVMEYLEGQDLHDAIYAGTAGDVSRRLEIARDCAKALEHIHEHSIVHRDIKPKNIHIDRAGRVRLMDFGIAKQRELNLTSPGLTLGTPYYMAPEQIRGEEVTDLADIYSFGILLFELFVGARPFTGEGIEQIFYRILNEPLDVEPLRSGGIPEAVCTLVAQCAAKEPSARPQSMTEARQLLDEVLARKHEARTAPPATNHLADRRTWVFLVAGIVLLALVAAIVYFTRRPPPPPPPPPPLAETLTTSTGNMKLVPAGEFLFGPDRQIRELPAFYIDRTEVPNWAFAAQAAASSSAPWFSGRASGLSRREHHVS